MRWETKVYGVNADRHRVMAYGKLIDCQYTDLPKPQPISFVPDGEASALPSRSFLLPESLLCLMYLCAYVLPSSTQERKWIVWMSRGPACGS